MTQPKALFSGKAIAGYVLIAVGILFLLDNLGILRGYDFWEFWPVILIIVGINHLLRPRQPGHRTWGALELAVGLFFLLRTLGVFWISIGKVWPAILVAAGAHLIWQASARQRREQSAPEGAPAGPGGPGELIASSKLDELAIFGGGDRVVRTADFRGGDVFVLFGGFDIDLREAVMTGNSAAIDVFVCFGGLDLRVPEGWNVVVQASPIFGSSEYKPPPGGSLPPAADRKTLTITGAVIFGGVEVKQ
jgi:predicted membrane protein